MAFLRSEPLAKVMAFMVLVLLSLAAVPVGGAAASTDSTPPSTRVTSPAPGAAGWYTTAPTLHLEPSDVGGSGVSRTVIQVGESVFVRWGAAPFDFLVRTDGATAVSVYAIDHAGNVETPLSFDMRVDSVRPEVNLISEGPVLAGVWFEGAIASLEATATDKISGVGRVEFHVWTTTGYTVVPGYLTPRGTWEGAWDTTGLEPQLVDVTALAADVAGNWAGTSSVQHLILPRA